MASNGQRPARTAQDVAQLEADNEYLHNELERVSRELAILTADRSRLQIENAMLEGRARENLTRATRMETIVRVHSAGLVAALTEITQERVTERAVRRQVQEEHMLSEEPPPAFLRAGARTPDNSRVIAEPSTTPSLTYSDAAARSVESDQDRDDRLRGAAERLADRKPPPFKRPAIDHTLADNDSRMPGGPFVQKADDDNLRDLAGDMQSKSG